MYNQSSKKFKTRKKVKKNHFHFTKQEGCLTDLNTISQLMGLSDHIDAQLPSLIPVLQQNIKL